MLNHYKILRYPITFHLDKFVTDKLKVQIDLQVQICWFIDLVLYH